MDGDAGRTVPGGADEVQRRIDSLERRVARLEAAAGAVPEVAPAAIPAPPPAPTAWSYAAATSGAPMAAAAVSAPPVPGPTTAASRPGAIPGWGTPVPAGAAPGWAATAPQPRTPRPSFAELVERYAGRILAWTGALALVAAATFFLSLAFSRGWIGEEGRVLIGVAVGIVAFAGGGWFLLRHNALMGHVLTAIGLGVFTIAIMAATRLYGLIPPEAGLVLALLASAAAAVIAIRTDARAVAAFGLVAALIAPPLLGAAPTLLTLAFVAITLVGTTAIALFRSWSWLPPLAFLLAAPQLASWLPNEEQAGVAFVALAGFWLLNLVAAAGEEARTTRDALRRSSATLVVANGAFLAWGLFVVFDGALEPWLGVMYVVAAAVHVVAGAWFLARGGIEHRFGTLLAGIGAAFIALAAVAQLGGAVVPAAWALEAVVLVWLAVRFEHRFAALAALVLGALAILHLALDAYPIWNPGQAAGAPFTHPATISLVVVTGSLLGSAWLLPVAWLRSALAAVAVLVATWAGPYELAGSALVAWFAGLAVAGVGLHAVAVRLPERRIAFVPAIRRLPVGPAEIAGAIAWTCGAWLVLEGPMSPTDLLDPAVLPAVPFTNAAALQGGLLILAAGVAAGIARAWPVRCVALFAAIASAAWLVPFEVGADLTVVLWCVLAALTWLVGTREPEAMTWFAAVACGLAGGATALLVLVVAPPSRLVVVDPAPPALLPAWWLSVGAVAALLGAAGARIAMPERVRTLLYLGAAATAIYGASIGVVAAFQASLGGSVAAEEVAKQAQVALSVLWMALGVVGLVAGLATHRARVRDAGLGLLALAAAKVFLVDLAALDVAYRVLSLAALGLLLLVSAWMFTRFRAGPREGRSGPPGGAVPT